MNDPNKMEPQEAGRGIETGFKMLTDPSFNAIMQSEGLTDLKKLLRLLLQGTYSINMEPPKAPDGLSTGAGDTPPDAVPPGQVPGGDNGQ